MGREWDHGVPGVEFWAEALRVAKPGAHLVAFGGARTFHRLACAIEDAGWEVRDCLSWLYGSGFPKSLDVSKAIDKSAGAEREVLGKSAYAARANTVSRAIEPGGGVRYSVDTRLVTAPATDAARTWQGWGTALKPAWEPVILARKPLVGTVAANVLAHGTGAINVDGCRISLPEGEENPSIARYASTQQHGNNGWNHVNRGARFDASAAASAASGRWPANVVLDEEAAAMLGEPSRFFYTAKASRRERGEGNTHPTVKPLALMRWLCRLVCPPGGTILDPFAGSGTTGIAALEEGFMFVGVEREAEYAEIARKRLEGRKA
jgi:site-specific DNA-methyltransferase (adenine-specific)